MSMCILYSVRPNVLQKDVRHTNQYDQQMDFLHIILILMHDAIQILVWIKY